MASAIEKSVRNSLPEQNSPGIHSLNHRPAGISTRMYDIAKNTDLMTNLATREIPMDVTAEKDNNEELSRVSKIS